MNNPKTCIFCLSENASSRDHIPPTSLWGGKKDSEMITVPCCENCRLLQQGDDEYLRTLLSISVGSDRLPSGQRAIEKTLREFARRSSRVGASQSYLNASIKPFYTNTGSNLGKIPQAKIDSLRFNRIAWRMHRGLIFHHYGQLIPEKSVDFEIQLISGTTILEKGLDEAREDLDITNFPGMIISDIGDGSVVQYHVLRFEENHLCTLSRMLFYKSVAIICLSVPK